MADQQSNTPKLPGVDNGLYEASYAIARQERGKEFPTPKIPQASEKKP